jgi:hypothetical protein
LGTMSPWRNTERHRDESWHTDGSVRVHLLRVRRCRRRDCGGRRIGRSAAAWTATAATSCRVDHRAGRRRCPCAGPSTCASRASRWRSPSREPRCPSAGFDVGSSRQRFTERQLPQGSVAGRAEPRDQRKGCAADGDRAARHGYTDSGSGSWPERAELTGRSRACAAAARPRSGTWPGPGAGISVAAAASG